MQWGSGWGGRLMLGTGSVSSPCYQWELWEHRPAGFLEPSCAQHAQGPAALGGFLWVAALPEDLRPVLCR